MLAESFGKSVLLLQGPVGPFFALLAEELRQLGMEVHKINFNGGDALFYRQRGAIAYRGNIESWSGFLREYLDRHAIETIALFGDCRPHHARAVEVAKELGKRVLAFEEGYIRPNFVTLEEGGTNYHSGILRELPSQLGRPGGSGVGGVDQRQPNGHGNADGRAARVVAGQTNGHGSPNGKGAENGHAKRHLNGHASGSNGHASGSNGGASPAKAGRNGRGRTWIPEQSVGHVFWPSAVDATFYAFAERGLSFLYPGYRHHRDLTLTRQFGHWFRGGVRKLYYAIKERDLLPALVGPFSKQYFLVALQVQDDFQVKNSEFRSVEKFIQRVTESFARAAPHDTQLVFKHHPMDRAHSDYTKLIRRLATDHGVQARIHYVHDLRLPELLRNARGTVVINSTVGLSSLCHQTPVYCASRAVYDCLAFQGSLDEFWRQPGAVDAERVHEFRTWLRDRCQVNGSFYAKLPGTTNPTGVIWPEGMTRRGAIDELRFEPGEHRGAEVPKSERPPSSKTGRSVSLDLASGEAE